MHPVGLRRSQRSSIRRRLRLPLHQPATPGPARRLHRLRRNGRAVPTPRAGQRDRLPQRAALADALRRGTVGRIRHQHPQCQRDRDRRRRGRGVASGQRKDPRGVGHPGRQHRAPAPPCRRGGKGCWIACGKRGIRVRPRGRGRCRPFRDRRSRWRGRPRRSLRWGARSCRRSTARCRWFRRRRSR